MEHDDRVQANRYIIGARVSTEEQFKKGVSISTQLDAGREKAIELGGCVVGYCVEPGISGSLYEGRPELQKALEQLEDGQADGLIWYDLSRMSRDIEFISAIEKRVTRAGGQLHFVTTEYSNTADGFLHRGIDSVIHQHQRLKLKEVSAANRRKVVMSGRQTQRAWSPLGYHIVNRHDVIRGTHTADQLGHYEIIHEQATVVREIFERYAAGDSLREICRDLQARGVKTPRGHVRALRENQEEFSTNVGMWRPSTVKNILDNSAYRGKATFGKKRNIADEGRLRKGYKRVYRLQAVPQSQWLFIECPPVVSSDIWDLCQERLKSAKEKFSATSQRRHILSGLLRCPKCERCLSIVSKPYSGKIGKRVACYCPYAYPGLNANRETCVREHFWQDYLIEGISTVIIEAVTRPDRLKHACDVLKSAQAAKFSEGEIAQMEAQILQLNKKIEIAVQAQLQASSKGIDPSVYENTLRDASEERSKIRTRLQMFKSARVSESKSAHLHPSKLQQAVVLALTAPEVPPLEKNKILSRIVEAVYPSKSPKDRTVAFRAVLRAGFFESGIQHVWENGEWAALQI